jgi:hypothetical protein
VLEKIQRGKQMKRTFYHGTSATNARKIVKEGFKVDGKHNWKVKSKKGFVYFSLAYAPFFAMNAGGSKLALVKVSVDTEDLYPEDDFLMRALGKPVYTQKELDKVDFEKYQCFWGMSLADMGSACAKPEKIVILDVCFFDGTKLIHKCDPVISPMNYKIMGNYYKELTEWIFEGNDIMEFKSMTSMFG